MREAAPGRGRPAGSARTAVMRDLVRCGHVPSLPYYRLRRCRSMPDRLARPSGSPRALEAHDVADDLGDGLVLLGRNLVVDLDRGIEGPRHRRVLDDRHLVLGGDLADLRGDAVG